MMVQRGIIKRLVWSLLGVTFDLCVVSPQEAKKRYDKETEKYCGVLEKHLSLSSRRKEAQLQEVENSAPLSSSLPFHLSHLHPSSTLSPPGGLPGGGSEAAVLPGVSGLRLQGSGGPGKEDVRLRGACKSLQSCSCFWS